MKKIITFLNLISLVVIVLFVPVFFLFVGVVLGLVDPNSQDALSEGVRYLFGWLFRV